MASLKMQSKKVGKLPARPLTQSIFEEVHADIVKTLKARADKDPALSAATKSIESRFLKPEHFHLVQELLTKDKKFAARHFFNEEFFPSILNRYRRMSRASARATIANTDMARFTPVLGAHNLDPLCYLLELRLDTKGPEPKLLRILLDCGWDERLDVTTLEPLHHIGMATIDVVLISHADLAHMGGLLYAIAKFPDFSAKIVVTEAVAQLAEVYLFDCLHAQKSDTAVDADLLDDLEEAYFELVQRMHADKVQYSQPTTLALDQISATAYAAGHTLGSALWKITSEYESVVYAVDFNHTPEGILEKLDVAKIKRPSVLITDCNFRQTHTQKDMTVKASDREIERLLHETFTHPGGGGNVLLPCGSARALELLFRLQSIWTNRKWARSYGILFCQFSAESVFERVGSMTEWMSADYVSRYLRSKELFKLSGSDNKVWTASTSFDGFGFTRYVMSVETLEQSLEEAKKANVPLAVIASNAFLECGLSKAAFMKLRSSRRNLVLLTDDTLQGTLLAKLKLVLGGLTQSQSDHYVQRKMESELEVSTFTPVPLQGEELRRWQAKQSAKVKSPRTPRTPRVGTPRVSREGEEEEEESEDDGHEDEDDFWALGKVFPMYEHKKPPIPFATAYGHRVVWGQDIAQLMKPDPKPENVTATVYPIMNTTSAPEPEGAQDQPSSPTRTGKKRRADEMTPSSPSTPRVTAANASVPTRPKLTRRVVRVECRVVEVYRPGRSNLQDKIHTIQHIQPQSLVLVHGRSDCTKALLTNLRKKKVLHGGNDRFFAPFANEALRLRSTHTGFKLMLSDALWHTLSPVRIGSFTLAAVRGTFHKDVAKSSFPVLHKTAKGGSDSDVTDVPESQMISRKPITLRDIQNKLKEHNIAAKFVAQRRIEHGFRPHKIYCENSKVEVLERQSGRLKSNGRRSFTIRGAVSVEYFQVRRLLYSMHAIV